MRTGAVALALISCSAGFRHKRQQRQKFIAGVPVTNYHLVNGGQAASLAEADTATSYKADWLVTVSKKTTNEDLHKMCARAHGACKMVGHPQGGVPVFELSGTEAELEKALEGAPGMALSIEPDVKVQIIDPLELQSDAPISAASSGWNLGHVGKPYASTSGKGVHIHVVDSGMRTSHTEFGGRAVPTVDMTTGWGTGKIITKECKRDDHSCAMDDLGHGTHCAGTAGGNEYGLATNSLLYNLKITFGEGSSYWSYAIGSLDWVALQGKRPAVVSASWAAYGNSPAVNQAVESLVDGGIIFISGAGNDNNDACLYSPGMSPASLSVGATDSRNERMGVSCYGKCVDLWAPGKNILSADARMPYGGTEKSGTSMAAPLVAGAAALLLESMPWSSPDQIKAKLLSDAVADSVGDITSEDNNLLLWVGAQWAKPSPGAPAPPCRRRFYQC